MLQLQIWYYEIAFLQSVDFFNLDSLCTFWFNLQSTLRFTVSALNAKFAKLRFLQDLILPLPNVGTIQERKKLNICFLLNYSIADQLGNKIEQWPLIEKTLASVDPHTSQVLIGMLCFLGQIHCLISFKILVHGFAFSFLLIHMKSNQSDLSKWFLRFFDFLFFRANENHQRCVAACLVQGIYIAERDRQLKRQGSEALASSWWDFFGFKLIRHLIDDADFSIFGGIYEFKPPLPEDTIGVPRYVIAFRGTLTKPESISRDLELDIHIIRNGLHRTSRFEIAMQAVKSMAASSAGASILWLTGHSMGAAMALLAGKTLAKTGIYIKSLLFNPPFVSPPIERIANERVRSGIRIAGSIITAGLALSRTLKQTQQPQQQLQVQNLSQDSLESLSSWLPDIHVNPGDHLCSEYIGFFEHRGTMEQIGYGAGMVERMAMQHSLGGLLMDAMGVNNAVEVEEPVHVIPSAKLIVNRTNSEDYKEAHGIHQWWRDDQDLISNIYLFK